MNIHSRKNTKLPNANYETNESPVLAISQKSHTMPAAQHIDRDDCEKKKSSHTKHASLGFHPRPAFLADTFFCTGTARHACAAARLMLFAAPRACRAPLDWLFPLRRDEPFARSLARCVAQPFLRPAPARVPRRMDGRVAPVYIPVRGWRGKKKDRYKRIEEKRDFVVAMFSCAE